MKRLLRRILCYIKTGRFHDYEFIGGTMADTIYQCQVCKQLLYHHSNGG